MAEYSDSDLLERFRDERTRNDAFNMVMRKYQQKLYWHIRRIVIDHDDANDVIQNTFIKVWKALENFREDSQLYTWLYRIATNEALTYIKQKRTGMFVSFEDVSFQLSETLHADKYFSADKLQLKLQKAILGLPEKQRIVFNLRYYEEMPYEEMSAVLGTSVGALKASYHHAVKKIEEFFKED